MQRTVFKLVTTLGLAAAVVVGSAARADAAVIITFENSSTATGSLAYGGDLGDALVGTDISFDLVTVGAISLDCTGCLLDFTSGGSYLEVGGDFVAFAGGGSFVITGTITDPNNGDVVVASGTLLTGTFSGGIPASVTAGASGQVNFVGSGTDEKNASLLRYFGFSQDEFIYANTGITATGCENDPADGFDCSVIEADVTNTQVTAPEPATMSLFGLALLGLGGAVRRRFSA